MTFDSKAQKARVLMLCRRDRELAEAIRRAKVEPPWVPEHGEMALALQAAELADQEFSGHLMEVGRGDP